MIAVNDFIHSTWYPVTQWVTAASVAVLAALAVFGSRKSQ